MMFRRDTMYVTAEVHAHGSPVPMWYNFVVKPRNNVLVAQPIPHNKRLGFIDRRVTGNLLRYTHRDSSILLLGNARIQRLGYFGGSNGHNSIWLRSAGIKRLTYSGRGVLLIKQGGRLI